MAKLRVVKIGNSLGVILPKQTAERLGVGKGLYILQCMD